jgi:DNA-binding beta-propeller fold protein YncE
MPGPYAFSHVIGRAAGTGAGLLYPTDLAVDRATGTLYATCRQQPRVSTWTLDGEYLNQFGHPGSVDPNGQIGTVNGELFWPASIALDGQGTVYVAEEAHHRLQKFTTTGQFLAKWESGTGQQRAAGRPPRGGQRHGQFNRPAGVAVDAEQRVYVADTLNHRVQKFTPTGAFVTQWGSPGAGEGQFDHPWGIDVDSQRGRVYVSDWRNDRVQQFDLDGHFLSAFGHSGTGPGEFSRPAGVAVDPDGNIAVADWGNDRIQVLAPDGTPLALLTGHGDQISKVAQVFLDARDDLVKLRAEYGAPHALERYFYAPTGVAFDGAGTLYAADTLRHRVQVYRRAAIN